MSEHTGLIERPSDNTVLHILGIDPGGTTGWAHIAVPFDSVYGRERGSFLEFETGHVTGDEVGQVRVLCGVAKRIPGTSVPKPPPAIVGEDFDAQPNNPTTDAGILFSPIRILAMLKYAVAMGHCGDARLIYQQRTIAMTTATDPRLKHWGLYVTQKDERAAVRHAITFIRRAKDSAELRRQAWR